MTTTVLMTAGTVIGLTWAASVIFLAFLCWTAPELEFPAESLGLAADGNSGDQNGNSSRRGARTKHASRSIEAGSDFNAGLGLAYAAGSFGAAYFAGCVESSDDSLTHFAC